MDATCSDADTFFQLWIFQNGQRSRQHFSKTTEMKKRLTLFDLYGNTIANEGTKSPSFRVKSFFAEETTHFFPVSSMGCFDCSSQVSKEVEALLRSRPSIAWRMYHSQHLSVPLSCSFCSGINNFGPTVRPPNSAVLETTSYMCSIPPSYMRSTIA